MATHEASEPVQHNVNSNRLIHETSPYLLQHAHNPVDWYPWGDEALQRARDEDRPILLSVGYSACHWCHVMERESFENPAIAGLMNQHFVNIKVDREERPDIDAIYMAAVQAMTGQGGWPMTVFLTPEGVPFYGGTYFPPEDRHGLPGFPRLLQGIAQAYRDQRQAIDQNVAAFRQNVGQGLSLADGTDLHVAVLGQAFRALLGQVDRQHGGLGGAPKFPQPSIWEFLLRTHQRTGDREALSAVEQTLQAMARGGIYDQLGGGFHRYSTDAEWLAPHFEKMLYDNAQLSTLYLHAFQVTGNPLYRRIVEETLTYVSREMIALQGGFYAAQDADSEGVEGKYFVWTAAEVESILGKDDAALFMHYYDVTPQGNWEGQSILRILQDDQTVARQLTISVSDLHDRLASGRAALLAAREQRVKPGRDEKILTSWNGLMLRAFAEAARVLDRADYREIAETNATFLLSELRQPASGSNSDTDLRLWHVYKDGRARFNGYLEDYAFLADGLLALYEATFEPRWFVAARDLADAMLTHFWDSAGGGFFSTSDDHEKLVDRPKDLLDNAIPSGNSVACDVLLRLAALTGDDRYSVPAERILHGLGHVVGDHPAAFPRLLGAADFLLATPREIALIGDPTTPEMAALIRAVFERYQPNKVVALAHDPADPAVAQIPLLAGRSMLNGRPTAYVCEHFACRAPVTSAADLAALLNTR